MPSKTGVQAKTMAAAAHDPKFAKKVAIPQGVAREFTRADQRARKGIFKKKAAKLSQGE